MGKKRGAKKSALRVKAAATEGGLQKLVTIDTLLSSIERLASDSQAWASSPIETLIELESFASQLRVAQEAAKAEGGKVEEGKVEESEESKPEVWTTFWEWASSAEVLCDAVEIGWMGGARGNGCRATRDIGK